MDKCGTVIENGWVSIENGKITGTGAGETKVSSSDIDAGGRLLIPGFIDAHTHLGIVGNALGFEADDCNEETDPVTPNLLAADGINPFDFCFEEAREAGVTTVLSSPGSANAIGGVICALKTNGRRIEKMATAGLIREHLVKAKKYLDDLNDYEKDCENNDLPEFDAKLDATVPLLKKEIKAHFHCHRADDILTAVRISKQYGLDTVLIHATEAHKIADLLAEDGACAVIGPVIGDRSKPELAGQDIKTAGVLHKNGVKVAICTDHPVVPVQYLALNAALAVKGGLDRDEALRAITVNAAEICGISDRVGSIEKGKDADIQLYSSDPLDVMSSPDFVMINGETVKDRLIYS